MNPIILANEFSELFRTLLVKSQCTYCFISYTCGNAIENTLIQRLPVKLSTFAQIVNIFVLLVICKNFKRVKAKPVFVHVCVCVSLLVCWVEMPKHTLNEKKF